MLAIKFQADQECRVRGGGRLRWALEGRPASLAPHIFFLPRGRFISVDIIIKAKSCIKRPAPNLSSTSSRSHRAIHNVMQALRRSARVATSASELAMQSLQTTCYAITRMSTAATRAAAHNGGEAAAAAPPADADPFTAALQHKTEDELARLMTAPRKPQEGQAAAADEGSEEGQVRVVPSLRCLRLHRHQVCAAKSAPPPRVRILLLAGASFPQ